MREDPPETPLGFDVFLALRGPEFDSGGGIALRDPEFDTGLTQKYAAWLAGVALGGAAWPAPAKISRTPTLQRRVSEFRVDGKIGKRLQRHEMQMSTRLCEARDDQ